MTKLLIVSVMGNGIVFQNSKIFQLKEIDWPLNKICYPSRSWKSLKYLKTGFLNHNGHWTVDGIIIYLKIH